MFAVLLVCSLLVYFLPAFITGMRKVDRRGGIILLNVLLGWTGVGWLFALIWACSAETQQQRLYRVLAERQLVTPPVVQMPSASLSAGRTIGSVVGRFRRDPDPPPSIR